MGKFIKKLARTFKIKKLVKSVKHFAKKHEKALSTAAAAAALGAYYYGTYKTTKAITNHIDKRRRYANMSEEEKRAEANARASANRMTGRQGQALTAAAAATALGSFYYGKHKAAKAAVKPDEGEGVGQFAKMSMEEKIAEANRQADAIAEREALHDKTTYGNVPKVSMTNDEINAFADESTAQFVRDMQSLPPVVNWDQSNINTRQIHQSIDDLDLPEDQELNKLANELTKSMELSNQTLKGLKERTLKLSS